jgi:hypothetical protein
MVLLAAARLLTTTVQALPVSGTSTFRDQGAPVVTSLPWTVALGAAVGLLRSGHAWKFRIYRATPVSPNPA